MRRPKWLERQALRAADYVLGHSTVVVEELKQNLKPSIRIVELEAHINDELFAKRTVDLLCELMQKKV